MSEFDADTEDADKQLERTFAEQKAEIDRVEIEKRNKITALKRVFSTADGAILMKHLEEYSGYGFPSYQIGTGTPGSIDAVFHDGAKSVVAMCKTIIEHVLPNDGATEKQTKAD